MASTTELRKSYIESAKSLSAKPLYAWAGAGDLAVEKLRTVPSKVKELRSEVSVGKLKSVPGKLTEESKKATEVPSKLQAKVNALPKTPKALSAKFEAQVKAVDTRIDELATRGETVVRRIRSQRSTTELVNQAKTTVSKAKGLQTVATRGANNTVSTANTAAKTTVTAAKSTVTAARKTAAKTPAAGSAAANKVGQ